MGVRDRFFTPQTARAIRSWRIAIGLIQQAQGSSRKLRDLVIEPEALHQALAETYPA